MFCVEMSTNWKGRSKSTCDYTHDAWISSYLYKANSCAVAYEAMPSPNTRPSSQGTIGEL